MTGSRKESKRGKVREI